MQYIREISKKINKLSMEFPVLVLTGARQVGKTTLLRELFPDHNYVSLDLPSAAEFAEQNPDLFLKKYPPPLIVDEVQYAPKIFRNLKVWIDQNRDLKGQIILTGSQKFILMKEISDSLAGRIGIVELEGLSLFEIQKEQKINNTDLPEILERGFFPELWKEKDRDYNSYYQSYLNTYLERDIRQIINVVNILDFEKFLRILASRTGQILEKSSLAKDVGVRLNTINSWLSVLEASNQIVILMPYFENFGSRSIKSPKFFFSDVGFCMYLLGLDQQTVIDSMMIGHLWENLVFTELRKRNLAHQKLGQFWYYRDSQGREVDLIFVHDGVADFIETKWSTKPDLKSAKIIEDISQRLKSKVVKAGRRTIISRTNDQYAVIEGVETSSIFEYELFYKKQI